MTMMLLAAALSLAGPGAERVFGSWVVACDNVVRCESSPIVADTGNGRTSPPDVVLAREPGPAGAVSLMIEIDTQPGRIVDLLIDRRLVATAPLREGRIKVEGAAAEGLARAMATGHMLTSATASRRWRRSRSRAPRRPCVMSTISRAARAASRRW
ncbi:MAG: hypothetical protein V4574_18410 [Pseudomonadota bacterium]